MMAWRRLRPSARLAALLVGTVLVGGTTGLWQPSAGASAPKCTISWTGLAHDGAWATAGNWNPARVPATSDYACVPSSGAIVTVGSATVKGLESMGKGLVVSGVLSFTGQLKTSSVRSLGLQGGTVISAGPTSVLGSSSSAGGALAGPITLALGAALTTTAGVLIVGGGSTLTNRGSLVLSGGSIQIGDGAVLDDRGQMSMADGTRVDPFHTSGRMVVEAGAALTKSTGTGSAVITAPFDNAGTVQVPLGSLNVTNFAQTSAGTLAITLDGQQPQMQFGQLNVNGTATLAGTISVIDAPGYIPPPASTYVVVTYAAHTGTFSTVNGDFAILYQPADVVAEEN